MSNSESELRFINPDFLKTDNDSPSYTFVRREKVITYEEVEVEVPAATADDVVQTPTSDRAENQEFTTTETQPVPPLRTTETIEVVTWRDVYARFQSSELLVTGAAQVIYSSDAPIYFDEARMTAVKVLKDEEPNVTTNAKKPKEVIPQRELTVVDREGVPVPERKHILFLLAQMNEYLLRIGIQVNDGANFQFYFPDFSKESLGEFTTMNEFDEDEEAINNLFGEERILAIIKERNFNAENIKILDPDGSSNVVRKICLFALLTHKRFVQNERLLRRWSELLQLDPTHFAIVFLTALGMPERAVDLMLALEVGTTQRKLSLFFVPEARKKDDLSGIASLAATVADVLYFNPYFHQKNDFETRLTQTEQSVLRQLYDQAGADVPDITMRSYRTLSHKQTDFMAPSRLMDEVSSITGIPFVIKYQQRVLNSQAVVWLGKVLSREKEKIQQKARRR